MTTDYNIRPWDWSPIEYTRPPIGARVDVGRYVWRFLDLSEDSPVAHLCADEGCYIWEGAAGVVWSSDLAEEWTHWKYSI